MKSELRISQGLIVHFLSITYESISHSKFLPSGYTNGNKRTAFLEDNFYQILLSEKLARSLHLTVTALYFKCCLILFVTLT